MRATQSAFVCAPTNHVADLTALEDVVKRFRQLGGKVPPAVTAALEAARVGSNVEQSMNVACDGLFRWYLAEEDRCAREVGFAGGAAQMSQAGGLSVDQSDAFFVCTARVARQWQWKNIDFTLNPFNADSAVRQFFSRTRAQVVEITGRWVKKKALDRVNGSPPPYENPAPRRLP
jgi:hypothetical protein